MNSSESLPKREGSKNTHAIITAFAVTFSSASALLVLYLLFQKMAPAQEALSGFGEELPRLTYWFLALHLPIFLTLAAIFIFNLLVSLSQLQHFNKIILCNLLQPIFSMGFLVLTLVILYLPLLLL